MKRKIVIENCSECVFLGTHGGFGEIKYVPYCKRAKEMLSYSKHSDQGMVMARVLPGVPDWCPLEEDKS